jgi:hypothetical protein
MKNSLFFVALFLFSLKCSATHLSGGEIYVERISPTSLTFRITIRVFTNTINTNVLFGGEDDWLNFGDGQRILVPETPNTIREDLGDGVAVASFTIVHAYATPSVYRITYSEPNWEEGIVNFDGSVNTRFFLEATIDALPGYLASPKFLKEPFVNAPLGQPFSMALTAKDTNNYRLVYSLVVPKQSVDQAVVNYDMPENIKLHPTNGLLEWDTKFNGGFLAGTFLFSVKVSQYDSLNRIVGSVVRNFIIRLDEVDASLTFNVPGQLDVNKAIFVPEGNLETFYFTADAADASTYFDIRSELTNTPGALDIRKSYTLINDKWMEVAEIVFHSLPEINRKKPYAIVVRARYSYPGGVFFRDFSMLVYTQDVAPEEPEDPITGIGEEKSKKQFVYPNPVSTVLYFDDWAIDQVARVVDMSGKIVFTKGKSERTLDVSGLSPGSYFVIPEKRGMNIQIVIKR